MQPDITFDFRNYSRAFIALHPFLQIAGYDPAEVGYGPYSVQQSGIIVGQAPIQVRLSRGDSLQQIDEEKDALFSRVEWLMKNEATVVLWSEIQSACRIPDLRSVQRALASIENEPSSPGQPLDEILRHCDAQHIFFPTSGHLQPAMERKVAAAFRAAGAQELLVSRMFSRTSSEVLVELLDHTDPIGSALRFAPASELRSPSDVQVVSARAGQIVMLSDDAEFFTTVLTTDAIAIDFSSYFEGFSCSMENVGTWWHQE
jgi:hypothetical protein